MGLMLTRVQIWSAEVHQQLTGPSWGKDGGSRREAAPRAPPGGQPSRNLLQAPRQGRSLLPIGPGLRALVLSSPQTFEPRHTYLSTAGGIGRCSCPRRPRKCPHWHRSAPHNRPCLPHRSVLQNRWGRSTCGEQGEMGGPTARWQPSRGTGVSLWPVVKSISPEFQSLLWIRPLLDAEG